MKVIYVFRLSWKKMKSEKIEIKLNKNQSIKEKRNYKYIYNKLLRKM